MFALVVTVLNRASSSAPPIILSSSLSRTVSLNRKR